MLTLEAARERILGATSPLPAETVRVVSANQRWLAGEVRSSIDLPPFDNSAMDGYALRAADVEKACAGNPVELKCLGETPAGVTPVREIGPGECERIFTGAPLPAGADAVVMQEDTETAPDQPGMVRVLDAVRPWDNVRFRGEDIKAGQLVARAGTRLNFAQIAALGAIGCAEVSVVRRPRIALLATGNELVEPGGRLKSGDIFESNRGMVKAIVESAGCEAVVHPIVSDDPAATRSALERAFAESDVVITSGGVSVGDHDHVKPAFEQLGGKLDFWRINMRPGKPFVFGRLGERWFFGLPGNPVSAAVTCLLLVRPALIGLQGGRDTSLPVRSGVLAGPISNPGGRRHFVRVKFDEKGGVLLAGLQGSHVLSGLAEAQGLIDVPPGAEWSAGRGVEVLLFP